MAIDLFAFDMKYRREPPLVPRDLCFGVEERITAASGEGSIPLDPETLSSMATLLREARVEAVAISFLNAYRNPIDGSKQSECSANSCSNVYISAGTTLTNEWGEFERASTAVANAYVGVRMKRYVSGLRLTSRSAASAVLST